MELLCLCVRRLKGRCLPPHYFYTGYTRQMALTVYPGGHDSL